MSIQQLPRTPWRMVSAAATWHVTSQHHARRNALIATTALTQRRRERLDVEEFLTAHVARADARASAVSRHSA
jgi:hypothetical protein